MFKKTIAVLLLFSIVLSSCGKKDKDKSNDFVREFGFKKAESGYEKALNNCIDIHLSCSVPSEACRKAQNNDPDRFYSVCWQNCLDSELCPEAKKSFYEARLNCFDYKLDYLKASHVCYKGMQTCTDSDVDFACLKSDACDKFDSLKPNILEWLDCPKYVPALSNPKYVEYSEAKKKYDDASLESEKACYTTEVRPKSSVCWEAMAKEAALDIPYTELKKSCLESELNGTSSEDEEEDEEKEELEEEEEVVAAV